MRFDTLHSIVPHRGLALLLALLLAMALALASGADTLAVEATPAGQLSLISGKSIVLTSEKAVKRVSVADPEVADFILLSPTEIYLTGKKAGVTNLTLWQDNRVVAVYDLQVAYDITRLKEDLHRLLPEEKELSVLATHDTITLAGKVTRTAHLNQAVNLAKAYAPEEKVTSLVEVGGVHQVMLEVRVAEMSKSTANQLGINLLYTRGEDFGVSLLSNLADLVSPSDANLAAGPLALLTSPSVNALFRFQKGSATWTGLIDALKEDGLAKVLAEPTLISLSGQSASFLAGGEFPVPLPQGLGTVAIEYKAFGVGLTFKPTVLGPEKIGIEVAPEVSELDFSTAVRFSGFLVPGLTTRRASTVVELADGQSFAIAGLLKETIREDVQKFPLLGEIPVLGALFQSKSFQKNETELVIVVTPRLVKPLDTASQPLPTDFYAEPNEAEFYLFGAMESRRAPHAVNPGGLDGDFGHAKP